MEEYNKILEYIRPDTPVHIKEILKQCLIEKSERPSFKEVSKFGMAFFKKFKK